ncbi:class I SAM-dependent methyltransferase [Prauserella cavernicola]|uniref:Methyltransferase domain-containing protein n=1 Tax=Prauserella cavernicola TaxID=2800127 RepID=A0A934QTS7_9PSEU|nr:class I SAM-dependent methyltransferase [Prauserella cavernicola]MBK1788107.1 methyltransferase domain-containing protein [Prauserella cavernicola]
MTDMKTAQQQVWAAGDYSRIGAALPLMSELLCEDADLRGGERVLDVATGSGNTALAAARRHCVVTGVDYVPALLERARLRASAEQLEVDFQVGDAEELDFPDDAFDVVLSTLGVMFAPDQRRTADELLRVCGPGGRIALTSWTPSGFGGTVFELFNRFVPAPPDTPSALRWGSDDGLVELFGDRVREVRTRIRRQVFRYPSVEHYVRWYATYFGPTIAAEDALDAAGRERLRAEFAALIGELNTAADGTLVLPAEYLSFHAVAR